MDREKLKAMIKMLPYYNDAICIGRYTVRSDNSPYRDYDAIEIVEHDTTEATDWIDGPIKLDDKGMEYILNTITREG